MDVPPKDPATLLTLAAALCSSLFAAFSGLALWNARRLVAQQDSHSLKIRTLEMETVKRVEVKADIKEIYEQLETMRSRAEERHLELLDRMNG